ncbi:SIMPL domain-containing protein [Maribacter sp. 2-571]|uniref:SIMPL domain-containing protein n=1 Tax=Maribacter sp. 2-571 TaxID=3417569 RepID=UPI003D334F75
MKPIVTIICCFVVNIIFSQQMKDYKNEFSVTGEAIVRVAPDQVVLQLGVESRGEDLLKTKSENAEIISKAMAYCREQDIADKHIQTDYVHMNPTYNYDAPADLRYYTVDQALSITLQRPEQYEEILTELLKIGINKVQGISFNTTKLKENRTLARKMAVEAAKEKALFLASEVGITLGEVTNVSEYSQNLSSGFGRFSGSNMSQNIVQNGANDMAIDGLSVGMIPIKASITLTYRIK